MPKHKLAPIGCETGGMRARLFTGSALASMPVTERRRRIGQLGEEIACGHLRSLGYLIVERNARTRQGELDIVARDGAVIVFVEVKTGRAGAGAGPERPALAVGRAKQRRLRLLAGEWLANNRPGCGGVRIDVIGITLSADADRAPELEHIEAAV